MHQQSDLLKQLGTSIYPNQGVDCQSTWHPPLAQSPPHLCKLRAPRSRLGDVEAQKATHDWPTVEIPEGQNHPFEEVM